MNGEDFQKVVLEKLLNIETDIKGLKEGQRGIENKLDDMEAKNANRHIEIDSKLNVLIEDSKSIHEVLGEHEISIRTLRRRPV